MGEKQPNNRPAGPTPRPAAKPSAGGKPGKKPAAGPGRPGDGLLGWLGRQVGHVSKAVKADVTRPPAGKAAAQAGAKPAAKPLRADTASRANTASWVGTAPAGGARPASAPTETDPPRPPSGESPAGTGETVIYRNDKVEVAELPDRPGVILRRTIIDEVVVEPRVPEGEQG